MSINFDSALGVHSDALRVHSKRAELLASNLTNADTPNYKARDIDFKDAMKTASSNQSTGIKTTHTNHISTGGGQFTSPDLKYRTIMQDSLDGNTVDEQVEQTQFMENSIKYQASLTFLGSKFKDLLTAVRGD
ncbi:MAG: flagellar basal body rod protein FlgB [Gammaproteobacteria bacterium]|nr:MAG: flagellar basal body rod protein FlgB [Gammaproteobacteria bacterium]